MSEASEKPWKSLDELKAILPSLSDEDVRRFAGGGETQPMYTWTPEAPAIKPANPETDLLVQEMIGRGLVPWMEKKA